MTPLDPTDRTRLRRLPNRGVFDRDVVNAILDEGLVCTLSFLDEQGRPVSMPTGYARDGERLLLHGSSRNASLRAIIERPASISVILLDGIVLARSAFHHSFNYRSVVLFGQAVELSDPAQKLSALERVVDNVVPGRAADCRMPTPKEMAATLIVSFPIEEASAKVRSGPPSDDAEDMESGYWAGVLPCETVWRPPISAPDLPAAIPAPEYVRSYRRAIS